MVYVKKKPSDRDIEGGYKRIAIGTQTYNELRRLSGDRSFNKTIRDLMGVDQNQQGILPGTGRMVSDNTLAAFSERLEKQNFLILQLIDLSIGTAAAIGLVPHDEVLESLRDEIRKRSGKAGQLAFDKLKIIAKELAEGIQLDLLES